MNGLVRWSMRQGRRKVLIHMRLGNKESEEDWLEHLWDMVGMGLWHGWSAAVLIRTL